MGPDDPCGHHPVGERDVLMAGTTSGGEQAAVTNRKRYGKDFYKDIGRMGGQKSVGGGFAKDPELARRAGRLGGLKSRRKRQLT